MTGDARAPAPAHVGPAGRRALLALARRAVTAAATHAAPPRAPVAEGEATPPALERLGGAFVTLTTGGRLRGCIGTFEEDRPLWQTVRDMAAAAATHDPRFAPLEPEDLPGLDLEISVLTPLRPIASVDDIEIGRHGLEVARGGRRGVLLPQVATDHGLGRDEFLAETCLKAGLPPDAWRDPATRIRVFEAEVFGDEPAPAPPPA